MAFAISTSNVSANPTEISPTVARYNTRVKFTITIKNETADDIDNIRIIVVGNPAPGFANPVGGDAAENLKLAADNLENAVVPLKQAGENLKLAGDNITSDAASAVASAGSKLGSAALTSLLISWENDVAISIEDAGYYLGYVGDNLAADSENFTLIAALLDNAATELHNAAGHATEDENMMYYNVEAAENLDNSAGCLENVARNLENGSLRAAGENLCLAGDYMENAGGNLKDNSVTTGARVEAAGSYLKTAGEALKNAADYENYAGYNLELVENYLKSAGSLIKGATDVLEAAGDNLENAAAQIGSAADNMQAPVDNILQAQDNLSEAAGYLATAASELGAALGGDELEDAMEHENAAAENMRVGTVGLKVAGEQLIAAADDLSAAASTMLSTANALGPTTWNLIGAPTNDVQFDTIGENENYLNPGETLTFVFLWETPNCANVDNEYTIRIARNKVDGEDADWITEKEITVTIDGTSPSLTTVVTQTGVVENNIVGIEYGDGIATVTITSSEEVSKLGDVTVENASAENIMPPLTVENVGNLVFTATFPVENITDNTYWIVIASASDKWGNENTTVDNRSFRVDTRAPIFLQPENAGLDGLKTDVGVSENVVQAGTGAVFRYVENEAEKTLHIRVEDNIADDDNDIYVTSVLVNTTPATRSAVVENLWWIDITLDEGYNSVIWVKAIDLVGNEVKENIENIFVDTKPPTITFNTVAGKTWDENSELINDSTPEIKVTVNDPGYPVSGLGIALENLKVYLDNDDNIANILPEFGGRLDNKAPWVVASGIFENVIDNLAENLGKGLVEGTYWINVVASDNLAHAGSENVICSRSFTIDVTAPTVPDPATGENPLSSTTVAGPYVQKSTTLILSGTGAEVDATLSVYINDATTAATTTTVDSAGRWTVEISLTAGTTTKVEVALTDVAGNEGDRYLYGYVMADASAPVVTLAELPETTDKASIVLSGTVTKDSWEDWSDITLTVQVGTGKVEVPCVGGSYSYSLALTEGSNTIVVQAIDAAGNPSDVAHATVERTVTAWGVYAIVLVIIALVMAAIAIFRKRR